jgi:predicted RNA binding protein YcfA (HicA-like mRNA interferase family)
MPPFKPIPFREVKRKLETLGFSVVSQKGSHIKFVRYVPEGTITAIVPRHKEITPGLVKSIIKQAMISYDAFDNA